MNNNKSILSGTVEDNYKHVHTIKEELSRGGQGVVYTTTDDTILIKAAICKDNTIDFNEKANSEYDRLRLLPIPNKLHVTMPIATLKSVHGYVMQMLNGMITFNEYFSGKAIKHENKTDFIESLKDTTILNYYNTGGLKRRLEAFMKSGTLLAQLHVNGLVYCDYSGNNVFISKNEEYGNVWLIDCDNLNTEINTKRTPIYTPGIGAPEVVRLYEEMKYGEDIPKDKCWGIGNTFASDCYTYAICLFEEIMQVHPFKGKKYSEDCIECDTKKEEQDLLEQNNYTYILSREDDSNSGCHLPPDALLTPELQELFCQMFSNNGKYFKWNRPTMPELSQAVAREYDSVIQCPHCGMDFVDPNNSGICPWCDNKEFNLFMITSYFYEGDAKGENVWGYKKEFSKDENFVIPMRIVNGHKASEIDDTLLEVFVKDSSITLRQSGESFNFEIQYSADGNIFNVYKSVVLNPGKFFLKIKDITSETVYLLEGEIRQ